MRVVGITGHHRIYIRATRPVPGAHLLIANGAGYPAPRRATSSSCGQRGAGTALRQAAAGAPRRRTTRADGPTSRRGATCTGLRTSVARCTTSSRRCSGRSSFVGLLLALIGVYGMTAYRGGAAVPRVRRAHRARRAGPRHHPTGVARGERDGAARAGHRARRGQLGAGTAVRLPVRLRRSAPYFMAGSLVALFAATVLAGVPPALRATRIDPVDTMRSE